MPAVASIRRRKHWSFSQINQYMRCPLQYFFERIARLPRPFTPSGLAFGSAMHHALAGYHEQCQTGFAIDTENVRQRFFQSWASSEEDHPIQYSKDESRDDLLQQGMALLEKYLEEPPPENIVAVEQEIAVPLFASDGEIIEEPLIAVIDLLCRDENGLAITEFKTSKRKYSEADLETALQGTTYVHAIRERYGEPASLQYCVLVKTKTPQIQRLATERSETDLTRLGDTVKGVKRAIEAKAFYPVENALNCTSCPFRQPCKEWQGVFNVQPQLVPLEVF